MSFSEFQKQALEAHNHYRQEHKVQPLALSKDLCNYAQEWANMDGATYKSKTTFSGGGVARNIAEGLCKLYGSAALISAFGVDQNGNFLKSTLPAESTVSSATITTHPTANCAVVLDNGGDCKLVVGDMSIHQEITPDLIYKNAALIEKSPLIVLDANLSYEALEAALKLALKYKKPVFYEPTDMQIAGKPFELPRKLYAQIKFMSPNLCELRKIAKTLNIKSDHYGNCNIEDIKNQEDRFQIFSEISDLSAKMHDHVENIIVTAGNLGVFIQRFHDSDRAFFSKQLNYINGKEDEQYGRYYPALKTDNVINASGAGDAFVAGFVTAMLNQKSEAICVSVGFQASHRALSSKSAVPDEFFDQSDKSWSTPAKYDTMRYVNK